jgi:uncharacterized protein (DUF849 family)
VTLVAGQFEAERVVITAAPNGARRTPADHPALPITPPQLADAAAALRSAGVSVLHLHVRDEQGGHTLDPARYREAMTAIRDRVGDGLVIQVTTEAVGMYDTDQQMAVVRELEPEAVSLALREICPGQADEARAARFFAWLRQRRIWPQYILYSTEDVLRFEDMRRRGLFADDAPFVLLVLGRYADGLAGRPEDLHRLLEVADFGAFPWAACCFGPAEQAVMLAAFARGGHVRIGFENNLQLPDGSAAADNAVLVRAFVTAVKGGPRRPASAAQVRAAFGFPG